ncbi:hypothetical protein [Sphingomonas sp. CARO-RG-8B-R24-01]|uniref:hypothetical protein n=1 Tax=Sphingomonas sp. CARO-RG-8B-R24-01 TaxID=2914831 RepID=UPI001F55D527|nr:hypothetical protein [Sphingomonas sp. CARO-RG-8B-R24-01]
MTIIVDQWQFRTSWNFIWIFLIPALLGIVLNTGLLRRIQMSVILPGVSLIALMVAGQLFGSMG